MDGPESTNGGLGGGARPALTFRHELGPAVDTGNLVTCHCAEGWICEAHPKRPWPDDDCPGLVRAFTSLLSSGGLVSGESCPSVRSRLPPVERL
jgi:hypothetical protein